MGIYKLPKIIGIDRKPPFGARINWHHPLSQGLVGAWLINEGAGNKIYDLIKNDLINGGAVWRDNVLLFTGTEYALASAAPISGYPLTLVASASCATINAARTIVHLAESGAGDGVRLSFRDSQTLWASSRNAATGGEVGSAFVPYLANITYFIVGVYPNSAYRLIYVNNIPGTPETSDRPFNPGINSISFGRFYRASPAEYLSGKINFIYIYNRALSNNEITMLYVNPYQMFWHPLWDAYYVPAAAPPPTGGRSIFGYDSIFHAGGIIQT